ncbi:TetR family transcriptional regulator [Afipia sp. P52-10]|jgi:AcrR family transcriptional regulator|uniref:TetR/AcrR family transcriptional regulator n=1 Tax=Afipia sp. P52-10 TaxID=1429916 RepID=UPI0003DF272A|nr:TetR/AcrR family transcriptional regulator [Afipia sp. P52-10]ETR78397.1 TetR family transcriptional regulator [Afipia sp. P52-10]
MVQKRTGSDQARAGKGRAAKPLPSAADPAKAAKAEPLAAKRRGRPRAYQPEVALERAMDVFWTEGFSATSLDALSAATGMNRPSLYGAFGDKRDIYLKAYAHYRDRARTRMAEAIASNLPLRALLKRMYDIALDMYLSGKDGPRGCLTVMTATSEAAFDPEIRAVAASGMAELDQAFVRILSGARARGELPKTADPEALGRIASAVIHTLAVRARAGVPKAELEAIIAGALTLICGPE